MGLDLEFTNGQTPLSEEDKDGLLIKTIATRAELDEFEQLGVEKAIEWLLGRTIEVEEILSEKFVKVLHKKMFNDVWKWAGEFRKSNKNLGIDWTMISSELKKLFDDCKYWIENDSFDEDEIAIRLSHRIVSIHPFANGNGRHSRLLADVLIFKGFRKPYFTWGSANLIRPGEARKEYLKALREADELDYNSIVKFARQ